MSPKSRAVAARFPEELLERCRGGLTLWVLVGSSRGQKPPIRSGGRASGGRRRALGGRRAHGWPRFWVFEEANRRLWRGSGAPIHRAATDSMSAECPRRYDGGWRATSTAAARTTMSAPASASCGSSGSYTSWSRVQGRRSSPPRIGAWASRRVGCRWACSLGIADTLGPVAASFMDELPAPEGDGDVLVISLDDKAVPMIRASAHRKRCRPPRSSLAGCRAERPLVFAGPVLHHPVADVQQPPLIQEVDDHRGDGLARAEDAQRGLGRRSSRWSDPRSRPGRRGRSRGRSRRCG